jgi:hypothetical protein
MTKNRPAHDRVSLRSINRSALLAIFLLLLAAILFYGPVLFYLIER